MGLDNYFKFRKSEDKDILKRMIEKIKNNKKLTKEIATYHAEQIVFKPKQLETIRLNSVTNVGLRPSLKIFFNNTEELKLIGKYLNVNWNLMEVGSADFLIKLLGAL